MVQASELKGPQRRFIGTSATPKPYPHDGSGKYDEPNSIPVGSSFFETDTGKMWRWDDDAWAHAPELTQGLIYEVLERIEGQLARTNDLLEEISLRIE